jgi:hypothetical protein
MLKLVEPWGPFYQGVTPPARAMRLRVPLADPSARRASGKRSPSRARLPLPSSRWRNTLEASIGILGDDIGIDIVINVKDLQDEGITKNQSFGLDERNVPADEILRKILKQANPDSKLVYIIQGKEIGGEETVYITTQAAVKKRGDKLPPELNVVK